MYTNECLCGKVFKDRITLDKHIEADHTQSGVWKCSNCSNTYTKRGIMFKHFRNAHDLTRLHHWCKIGLCEYGHDNLTTLKKHHQECHNIESDVKCQKCGKVFSQNNKLRDHEIICKTEFKPFSCDHCGKGYRSLCRLREHMQNDQWPCGGAFDTMLSSGLSEMLQKQNSYEETSKRQTWVCNQVI